MKLCSIVPLPHPYPGLLTESKMCCFLLVSSLLHSFKILSVVDLQLCTFQVYSAEIRLHTQICCCSVAKLCLTVCDPIDCSMPGFPVVHCLLEFAQIYVH